MRVAALVIVWLVFAGAAFAQTADTISIDFKDAPLQSVVDLIFKGSGSSYMIEGGVDKDRMIPSMSLKDLAIEQALRAVTRAAGVTWHKNGGIYCIAPKAQIQTPPPIPQPEPQPPAEVTVKQVEKIQLSFVDAQDVARLFGGTQFVSRGSVMVMGGNGQHLGGNWTGAGIPKTGMQSPVGTNMYRYQNPYANQFNYQNPYVDQSGAGQITPGLRTK